MSYGKGAIEASAALARAVGASSPGIAWLRPARCRRAW